jgi:hypothetical protein
MKNFSFGSAGRISLYDAGKRNHGRFAGQGYDLQAKVILYDFAENAIMNLRIPSV